MTASQLEPARVHPRRRPASKPSLPALGTEAPSASSTMQLRKGETFNTPTTPLSDRDPVMDIRALPRRSPTTLEAIAASEQRMTSILERLTLNSPVDQPCNLPSPKADPFSLNTRHLNVGDDARQASSFETDEDHPAFRKSHAIHSHGSDSGLGSSVSSVAESAFGDEDKMTEDSQLEESAIKSPTLELAPPERRQLNLGACKQIERYILAPLLRDQKFKPFHALVESIPKRIVNKQIVCLRDLEKTLLWLKPKPSISRHSYLHFSEFTIQSLHTSVSHLSVRDQRLPTDRPYTNGYFLDLVSQVRRYAAMMQASRDRADSGSEDREKGNDKDKELMPPPTLKVVGGLSKDGRPVELVATEGSTSTSMATGELYDPESPPLFKRTMSDEADEGVERSMARRKKNAPPMDINQKCDHCDKVFKRPCDLTKHEKTHSRPWKCTEPTCKYAQIGWPTEKERDRHVNDKHSDTPNLFKCKFQPCTYASKRESNCKQHMEKAHGWVYVRSKNNARGGSKSGSSVQATPSTPSVASTPISNPAEASTPASGPSPSPSGAAMFSNPNFNFNDPPAPVRNDDFPPLFEASPYAPSSTGMSNNVSTFSSSINFDAFQAQLQAGDPNGLIPALEMHRQSMNSMSVPSANSVPDLMGASMSFDGSPAAPTDNQSFNFDFEWSNLDMSAAQDDYTAMNMPFAPSAQSGNMGLSGYAGNHGANATSNVMSYGTTGRVSGLSPNAQGNLMLYSPGHGATGNDPSNQYGYTTQAQANAGNDFTLYDQFNRMSTPGMSVAPPMAQVSTGTFTQSNQMIPALNEHDSMFQGPHIWTEQSTHGANSENGFPQEMDADLMNTK